jgi:glycosyltransferase involved in cell wall biosynthesis
MTSNPPSPSISVLLPTYNYARFLPEAIESVLAQDWPDFELLISDDRSTDDSAAVIAAYAARDPRIRYRVQPTNLGMVANWNWCLNQARGEYIKFLFGDDRLASPQALRKLHGLLVAHPTASLTASARTIIRADSTTAGLWDEFQQAGRHEGESVIVRCLTETRNLIGEPSVTLFRRRHATRGYDPRYRQIGDLEFWFHLLEQGDFVYTAEPLCSFRHHALQQSEKHAVADIGRWEMFELFAEYRDRAARRGRELPVRDYTRLYHHLSQHCRRSTTVPPTMISLERDLAARVSPLRYAAFRARRHLRHQFPGIRTLFRRLKLFSRR